MIYLGIRSQMKASLVLLVLSGTLSETFVGKHDYIPMEKATRIRKISLHSKKERLNMHYITSSTNQNVSIFSNS